MREAGQRALSGAAQISAEPASAIDMRFTIPWWIMVGLTSVSAIGHLSMMGTVGEPVLFMGWLTFNLYALAVLVVPFRRHERWAWYTSWLFVLPYVAVIAFDSRVGVTYAVVGAIFAACLLVTHKAMSR